MSGFSRTTAIAGLALFGCLSSAAAQSDFQWRGRLTPGQTVEIKGINGDVRAVAASTPEVEVTAIKSARRGSPADVRIEVVPNAGGVTICAVYPDTAGRSPYNCAPASQGRSEDRDKDNDTVVNFTVRVPTEIGFVGRTVNGQIEADSLQSNVEGHTVNGSVRLSTTGLALASTVNGSITASMGRADWQAGARFSTVNGSITLNLPSVVNAELRADIVHGSLASDFPVTVTSQLDDRRRLRGTLGSGGPELRLSTVNGSIKLLRNQ
jgi:hypothetical protein